MGLHAGHVVDAKGQVVAPGFIDVHTHDDMAAIKTPEMTFKISQGVTTVVAGNCGISVAPFSAEGNFPPPFPLYSIHHIGRLSDVEVGSRLKF